MKSILIKNGRIIIDSKKEEVFNGDILIENGIIKRIDNDINEEVEKIIDAKNNYVSAGFIDGHVHAYPIGRYGMEADLVGINRWASTIVDAGTSGSSNFLDFKKQIDKAKTKVYVLLNLSKQGLNDAYELDDLNKLDEDKVRELVNDYPQIIVGLKARASSSAVGKMGIKPIELTVNLAHELKIPVLIHIGNAPPALKDTLNLLDKNDIITHAFHGKNGGIILDNQIIDEAIKARNRGVKFDLGHGEASFSFNTYLKAKELGFYLDSISSDLHKGNYNGPVYSIVECVNKIINLGDTLFEAIDKVTRIPANHFKLNNLGELKENYIGDVFIFSFDDCLEEVKDSMGNTLILKKRINPINLIYSKNNESNVLIKN